MALDEAAEKRLMRLVSMRYETADTFLYEFAPVDDAPLVPYEPGAHIDLYLEGGMIRQYSLARPFRADGGYVVGIKREAAGRGGSQYIHEHLNLGSELMVDGPRNNFVLHEGAEPVVLIAGGIGITPIICMAQQLRAEGRVFEIHYAVRSASEIAFGPELALLGARVHVHCDDEAGGMIDLAGLVKVAPENAHFYCCGPLPMLEAYEKATVDVAEGHMHIEYFSLPNAIATEGGFTVVLARSGKEIAITEGTTILEALRAEGMDVPASCEQGVCGTCETKVLEGEIDHRDVLLTPQEQARNNTMMICCSGSKSARLVLDL